MLKDYAEKHPNLSQKEVGLLFNISASRVSRILKRERDNHQES